MPVNKIRLVRKHVKFVSVKLREFKNINNFLYVKMGRACWVDLVHGCISCSALLQIVVVYGSIVSEVIKVRPSKNDWYIIFTLYLKLSGSLHFKFASRKCFYIIFFLKLYL